MTLEVSHRARGPSKGGSLTPLKGQNGEIDHYHCFFEKSSKMTVRKHIYGLVGLSGHPRGGHGQRCHGVAHERHQNAQKWPPLWAPPSTHIYEEKKMKKNEKNPDFLRGTNAVTFQHSNHDKKMMLWGRGVAHGGAQMWRKIWQFYRCDQSVMESGKRLKWFLVTSY